MLVATDIAARGIHVDDIELVVHVDPPAEHKAYLHRSGRTARAGAGGTVVTVATAEQMREVSALAKKAAIVARTVSVAPGAPAITELTGPPADLVAARRVVAPADESPRARSGGRRRGGVRRSSSTTSSAGRGAVTRSMSARGRGSRGGSRAGR